MGQFFKLLIMLVVVLSSICNAASSEPNNIKTEVVIIGTIHANHYVNPNYPVEVLRDILLELKPDVVLNELPLTQVDPNGRPLHRDHAKYPEGWAADTVAAVLKVRQIPFDRPNRDEFYKNTHYFKRQKQSDIQFSELIKKIAQKDPNNPDLKIIEVAECIWKIERDIFLTAGPEIINSEIHDNCIRAKKKIDRELFSAIQRKYPETEFWIKENHFFTEEWIERNTIMSDNIVKVVKEYPGKRIVVVTGATHRYILRDLLKANPDIAVKEYWEVINFDIQKSLKNIKKE